MKSPTSKVSWFHLSILGIALGSIACGGVGVGADDGISVGASGSALTGDLVVNGTFETDLTGWALGGAKDPIRSTMYAHGGAAALRLGSTTYSQREPRGDSWATQDVAIPASAGSVTLTFWAYATTEDTRGDSQVAEVRDTNGRTLSSVFDELSDSRQWTPYTVDLSAYRGQTVELYFNVHSDGGKTHTSMWIDDVALTVDDGAPGGEPDAGSGEPDAGSGEPDAGSGDTSGTYGASVSVHTTMGIPDDSTTSTSNPDHYLSVKPEYVVSYDEATRTPNWVAWELDPSWLGNTARTDDYREDDTLPSSFVQASNSDYSGSGYDRGHMCPAGDRTDNTTDMSSTFYLTNMVPQAANNNRGPWEYLEAYSRSLANAGDTLFIEAGPIYDSNPATIGADHVEVPIATWKVVVVLTDAHPTAASVTTSTRVIAEIIPNDDSRVNIEDDWRMYRTTVDDIESQTGLDLLSDVAPSVQSVVESRVDDQ